MLYIILWLQSRHKVLLNGLHYERPPCPHQPATGRFNVSRRCKVARHIYFVRNHARRNGDSIQVSFHNLLPITWLSEIVIPLLSFDDRGAAQDRNTIRSMLTFESRMKWVRHASTHASNEQPIPDDDHFSPKNQRNFISTPLSSRRWYRRRSGYGIIPSCEEKLWDFRLKHGWPYSCRL